MGLKEDFTFWHLENKKWEKNTRLVDTTTTIENLRNDWLEGPQIQDHPLLYHPYYSLVYDGLVVEDAGTLAGKNVS